MTHIGAGEISRGVYDSSWSRQSSPAGVLLTLVQTKSPGRYMTHLGADKVPRQVYDRLQLDYKVPEQGLVTILEQLHLRQGVDVYAEGDVRAHLPRQVVQSLVFVCRTKKSS